MKPYRHIDPTLIDAEAFWDKVHKKEPNECWMWGGAVDRSGYGIFSALGKPWRAHRLAYAFSHGSICNTRLVCHKCDTPGCVNPHHLFEGTHKDNMQDSLKKGRRPKEYKQWFPVKTTRPTCNPRLQA